MADPRPNKLRRYARRAALVLVLLTAFLAALFLSFSPTVASPTRPTARDVAAAREVWEQLEAARGATVAQRVRISDGEIGSIAALASDATGLGRFAGRIERGVLSGEASVQLPAGLWINVSASAAGEHAGFPAFSLKVGRVRFPLVASRWAADLVRQALRLNGVSIPPIDRMIRRVEIGRQDVVADLVLPQNTSLVGKLIAARGPSLDEPLVARIYCRIAASQQAERAGTLSSAVARAFDPAHAQAGEAYNRAAFVALSFAVVGDKARALAPQAAKLAEKCPLPALRLTLHGREDLAKHWTFSAGLTAVLGGETAASLGEWKELDDSLPDGSGFSFVDLAADRAGMRTALRALHPDSTARATAELAGPTDDRLMPRALLRAPEGISEAAFVERFDALDRERYRRAVESIDRTLARQTRPPGN